MVAARLRGNLPERGQAWRNHTQVRAVSSLFFSHLLERGNLAEEILYRPSRASNHFGTWNQIRHDARLCPDLGALTDPKMPGYARLPAHADEILEHG